MDFVALGEKSNLLSASDRPNIELGWSWNHHLTQMIKHKGSRVNIVDFDQLGVDAHIITSINKYNFIDTHIKRRDL